jgi:N-acetylmuramoyl-L-alanine amidase/CW_7 repeat
MTATIAYDKSVKNLIDQLSATGHVTHTAFKKTSVTLHHNGGRLSHEGVLNVWKTRAASAHFDVDGNGAVAQFVKVNEYAWAVGDKAGNQSSISVEMANATLSPEWTVSENTWKSAARLAGWLFARVIGVRPSKNNFFYHHHWSATDCAGPYMDKITADVLKAAQAAYDSFVKLPTVPPIHSAPPPPVSVTKSVEQAAKDVLAGKYGNGPNRIRRLTAAGYNAGEVQIEVNRELGVKPSPPKPAAGKKSVKALAAEVIAGKWGDDPKRSEKLTYAGYDPRAVQREVNLRLK